MGVPFRTIRLLGFLRPYPWVLHETFSGKNLWIRVKTTLMKPTSTRPCDYKTV